MRRWGLVLALAIAGCTGTEEVKCGDGIIESAESCDSGDGSGDGCTSCAIDTGWTCSGSPSVCAETCGDGLIVGDERCDDQNDTTSDGCVSCRVEIGWTCVGTPCTALCGDGRIVGEEACDDRNIGDGDGCSAQCRVETDFECTGEPSVCTPSCMPKDECRGLDCRDVDDGCGGTLNCGACTGWFPLHNFNDPVDRRSPLSFWTGTDLLIFGGFGRSGWINDGARYDPVADRWNAISTVDAPDGFGTYTSVFTGDDVILWGGGVPKGTTNRGWRYDIAEDSWSVTSTIGAPEARVLHVAAWTGNEMFVFGGEANGVRFKSGGLYDPLSDTWRPVPTSTAAPAAYDAVWTGTEVYVQGDFTPPMMFRPSDSSWRVLPEPPFDGRGSVVWTGREVFLYGRVGNVPRAALFDPQANTWRDASSTNIPSARFSHTLVWTRSEAIVWGGRPGPGDTPLGDGARYDPTTDTWQLVESLGAPSARYWHSAVWSDLGMFVWGGQGDATTFGDGARFVP